MIGQPARGLVVSSDPLRTFPVSARKSEKTPAPFTVDCIPQRAIALVPATPVPTCGPPVAPGEFARATDRRAAWSGPLVLKVGAGVKHQRAVRHQRDGGP